MRIVIEHVHCLAGRRTPNASIGVWIAGNVPDTMAHAKKNFPL
jgi:hypothetical protein